METDFKKTPLEEFRGPNYEAIEERSIFLRHLATETEEFLVPVGAMLKYPQAITGEPETLPPRFVRLQGQELDRQLFRKLFSVFGTKYGSGDGRTTFTLPTDPDFIVRT